MNLNILWGLIIYYSLISIFWISATASGLETSTTTSNDFTGYMNTTEITQEETKTTIGVGDVISTIFRFLFFVIAGIGLPDDTPAFIVLTFAGWQIGLNIFTAGFIYQAIRGG